jgi:hypothetical protein
MTDIGAILWKIGSSIVVTVPSRVVKEFDIGTERKILSVSLDIGYEIVSFLARPWKCGGSFVVTVPSSCVEVYSLGAFAERKTSLLMSIKNVNAKSGRTKHGNTAL